MRKDLKARDLSIVTVRRRDARLEKLLLLRRQSIEERVAPVFWCRPQRNIGLQGY